MTGLITSHAECSVGTWTMSEWRPPELAGIIDRLWYSEGVLENARERVFPNGFVEMVVHLAESYRLVEGRGNFGTTCLSGLQSRAIVIDGPQRHRVLGVRLHPLAARAVLACPMSELTDFSIDLADALGRAAGELAERCAGARTVADRFRVAAGWVVDRVSAFRPIDDGLRWAVSQIERTGGRVEIGGIRDRLGMSSARLTAAFRDHVGLSPKRYARVVRFQRARSLLHGGAGSLVEVAMATGYYDQAHMNAEFRQLGDTTPGAFLAAMYPQGDGSTAID